MKVGVLGVQGDVREHISALGRAGADPVIVRHAADLEGLTGLVIPGGESTTIGKLVHRYGLLEPIRERAGIGLALYGTCAGLILMARYVTGDDDAPHRIDILDVTVRRNAYGRQAESFEEDIAVDGMAKPFRAVFIRAPVIESVGEGVEVLASHDSKPVLVRSGRHLASTFHPEMTDDVRVHAMFVDMISPAKGSS